jgi:hypothetical protein
MFEVPIEDKMVFYHERLLKTIFEAHISSGIVPMCKANYAKMFASLYSKLTLKVVDSINNGNIFSELRKKQSSLCKGAEKEAIEIAANVLVGDILAPIRHSLLSSSIKRTLCTKIRRCQRVGFHVGVVAGLRCLGFCAHSHFLSCTFPDQILAGDMVFLLSDEEPMSMMEALLPSYTEMAVNSVISGVKKCVVSDFFIGYLDPDVVLGRIASDSARADKFGVVMANKIFHHAINYGAFIEYIKSGVQRVSWACADCNSHVVCNNKNIKVGPQPIGTIFPSGSMFPGEKRYEYESFLIPDLTQQDEAICPWLG